MSTPVHYIAVFAQAAAPVAVVFGALAIATKRGAIREAIGRCRGEFVTNLWLVLINYGLLAPAFALAAGFAAAVIPTHPAIAAFWDGLWAPVTIVLAILIIDLAAYWRHRAEHSRCLWQIHATHHSDETLHWLSVTRKHPLGRLLSMVTDNALVLAMGLPVWAIVAANLLRSWWGYFAHADLPWTLGPLGKVMISPAAHRLHHIRDETLMGTNFANTVTLWDRVFGTYRDPAPYLNCQTGIAGGSRHAIGELARPFEALAQRLRGAETAKEANAATAN